jgi:catechol 2,3-dioxygenase-like lactoylglutathione lyase family enzyme
MRKLALIIGLGVLGQVGPLNAQLAPVNEMGISIGHMHVFAADREKEARAWLALGGQLGNNVSNNIPVGFPGIVILVGNPRPANLGSEGSVIDHVAFRVPDLQASMDRWKGVQTWWKNGRWFAKIEPGAKAGQAFVTTPGGIKIEILEDKSLKVPIVFDHVHYYIDEARLKAMEDYYVKMFGAKPVKGETDTFTLPGGKLIFAKAATAPMPTTGRTLDHVGFNMLNAEALGAFSKAMEERGAKFARPYEPASMGMIRVVTDFGTNIEVTKAQGGYFDTKLLDQGYYQVDEGGKKEGENPTYKR